MSLRSNYEPGTSRWATRRAQWLALGLSDADMLKPKIGLVNTSSQLAICDQRVLRVRDPQLRLGGRRPDGDAGHLRARFHA
jgi:dihydroxy-acid dehydratase